MKLAPQSLRFGDAEFCKLVEAAIKDCVLTYNPPKFCVSDVTFMSDSQEWEIELDEGLPTSNPNSFPSLPESK